ncbi:hypothetical protein CVT25_003081 [Psilocybe cyanescens]|uniref:DUF1996 domain-containing protein n=1 Tax=Psilocybe cyanescens TaxID=93625 RepID=A0A409X4Q0_PSICY|nr:hypothetical protein CVT25_003081 [Psilocybe cyanescens]
MFRWWPLLLSQAVADAYWLMAAIGLCGLDNILTTQRIDPIVDSGLVSTHVHAGIGRFGSDKSHLLPLFTQKLVVGGSSFGLNSNTDVLRASQCTSIPIPQDKSNYWYPRSSYTAVSISSTWSEPFSDENPDYLFSDTPGNTTAFPNDLKNLIDLPNLVSYAVW